MKVSDIMITDVLSCGPGTDLATAGRRMLDGQCGVLPVVDGRGKVMGVITDRDICLTLIRNRRHASHINVSEAMTLGAHVVSPEDGVGLALGTMKKWRVRRLPVVNQQGRLAGIVSMDDIVLRSSEAGEALTPESIIAAQKAIYERRPADARVDLPA